MPDGTDYTASFEELALPPELKRAVIAHHGELTPSHRYLRKSLDMMSGLN